MKSLARATFHVRNEGGHSIRLRPKIPLPRTVASLPQTTTIHPPIRRISQFPSSPALASLAPTAHSNPHHQPGCCRSVSQPSFASTTEIHPFSTYSHAPSPHQRHLLASIASERKSLMTGWRLPQSLLGAMGRFQSQLNLFSVNEVSMGIKAPGRSIECEELIQMVEEGVRFLLIDVRDRKEVETTGSIQGAKLIPLPELKSALLLDEEDFLLKYGFSKPAKTDRNIVFYGQGAVKSNSALEIAGKLGYKGVLRMAGGYDEWIEKTHLDGRI